MLAKKALSIRANLRKFYVSFFVQLKLIVFYTFLIALKKQNNIIPP